MDGIAELVIPGMLEDIGVAVLIGSVTTPGGQLPIHVMFGMAPIPVISRDAPQYYTATGAPFPLTTASILPTSVVHTMSSLPATMKQATRPLA